MEVRLDGKVALVSGGTGNLGRALARRLAESGAQVALIARDQKKLDLVTAELRQFGAVRGYASDITQVSACKDTVKEICADCGRIDILISCAAKMVGGPSLEVTEEVWDDAFALNPRGMFFLMKEVVEQSMKEHGGSIVNISSVAGVRGMSFPLCNAVYSATKGAVNSLTMQAATEWGKYNIRCNAIAPGAIMPDEPLPPMPEDPEHPPLPEMAPLGHSCSQSEVTALACYLASDLNRSITGQVIVMDGGASTLGF